jgi:hypothetical protein
MTDCVIRFAVAFGTFSPLLLVEGRAEVRKTEPNSQRQEPTP